MKKNLLLIVPIACILVLSGCSFNPFKKAEIDMAKLDEKGLYNYKNEDLGFSISFPEEFRYYQTQRLNMPDFTDIEVFVPTADTKYKQEVPGYGKVIVIRVYKTEAGWEKPDDDKANFEKLKDKSGRIYAIKFWRQYPSDWNSKWNDKLKKNIVASFSVK